MPKAQGSWTGSALGLAAFAVAGLCACKREPSRAVATSSASPDIGRAPSRANSTAEIAPSATSEIPPSSPAALASTNSRGCGLEPELEALTRTAEAPEQAAAELRRPLLGPAQARAYAAVAAKTVVDAIANNSYSELANWVDPRRGLCLRPAKGASCRRMSIQELRVCGEAKSEERWGVDDGSDEGPSYTCREAFARIFFGRDFRGPNAVRYNCFPAVGRGNNADTILSPPVHRAYVEYFAEEQQPAHADDFPLAWRSLWLVFDGDAPRLVELIAEYWGP